MGIESYEYKSEFALRYVERGRDEGRGLALLTLVAACGLEATPSVRARIGACTDAVTLDAWITRAATASTLADVFGEGGIVRD